MVCCSDSKKSTLSIKFLCSYGGKIVPRPTDGALRYLGGLTRVLSVDRSLSFAELLVTLGELCGFSVTLRCQLPNGDLETLVSVKSDEELANIIEIYHCSAPGSKIRAILTPYKSLKQISPPPSVDSAPKSTFTIFDSSPAPVGRFLPRASFPPVKYPLGFLRQHVRARGYYPRRVQEYGATFYLSAGHCNLCH